MSRTKDQFIQEFGGFDVRENTVITHERLKKAAELQREPLTAESYRQNSDPKKWGIGM
ncbi:hypothetical protein IC617_08775 [Neiella sp. HB171785]|uniref:Uncharacterized protein n=1 Tax=Neiella litorisoli TaxID=2771431 RepID=A0A8J6ULU7_9GAMM|nr:hypothetical protein [Neiella litorisoli]MBD1389520.1 hypothetical protein [Neiella litorisoli]